MARKLSVRFPLCVIVMELVYELRLKGQELQLRWVPKEQNLEADALSNGQTGKFRESNRAKQRVADIPFHIMPDLMEYGEKLLLDIDMLKNKKGSAGRRKTSESIQAEGHRPLVEGISSGVLARTIMCG